MSTTKTRRQTVNFLGFLRGQLSGLQGIPTLCYELIQNADDVKDENDQPGGATRISFDICDDALWVENDGLFREIDFDRMEQISWGNKRDEADTTGSFGIGFVSVYQVTDSPELFSSGQHWQFQPQAAEDKRIIIEDDETEHTRFRLPWAFETSPIRQELGISPVHPDQLDDFAKQFVQSIENAALFLKQVRTLEVKRNGKIIRKIEVIRDKDKLLLADGDETIEWQIIEGDFSDQATEMQRKYGGLIEKKRKSIITLAIPDISLKEKRGLLYAFLPSETHIRLPFHMNADFYPSSDRKRILFDQDYKSEWNRLAIACAAQTLAENTDKLLQSFLSQEFWEFAETVKAVSESQHLNAPLKMFWELLKPQIKLRKSVLTSADRLVIPSEANYLDSDPEIAASTIFEELNIHTVHQDLRKYRNTLIDVSVKLLKIDTVGNAFQEYGLSKRAEKSDLPISLQNRDNWPILWKALYSLWDGASQQDRFQIEPILKQSAIAYGSDGAFWPPEKLFTADKNTRSLFENITNIVWFERKNKEDIPSKFVTAFDLDIALQAIEEAQDNLPDLWEEDLFSPQKFYEWLENHPETNYLKPEHRERIRQLNIWPTADGSLKSLEGLFLPGDFEDPLNLARFVDVETLGGGREFLERNLEVSSLDFITYIKKWIPSVLQSRDLSTEKRIHLLKVMALNLGKMQGDYELQNIFRKLNVVWCGKKVFCTAQKAYFDIPIVREVLGTEVSLVKTPDEQKEPVRALYVWLGVVEEPRSEDVITRIRDLTSNPPTRSSVISIQEIYAYLGMQWDRWEENRRQLFATLKHAEWLPGNQSNERWFKPTEVHTIFQDYLFSSQGNFLNIPRKVQEISRNFNRFLEINREPKPEQVVRHLLLCSKKGELVNKEVYKFLANNVKDVPIHTLKETSCLLLKNEAGEEKYYFPHHVFWNQHPFGNFRFQLGPEFGQFKSLFDLIGVKKNPDYKDAISVLLEISNSQYAQSSLPISENSELEQVIISCWKLLSEALLGEEINAIKLKELLSEKKTIPNSQNLLYRPGWLFIEDRPGWGQNFTLLKNNLIEKTEGTWLAMEAAGVQRISKAVKTELHKCENPREDLSIENRLSTRKNLLLRISEAHYQGGFSSLNIDKLDNIFVNQVDEIEIVRSFQGFGGRKERYHDTVDAAFIDETLYYTKQNGTYPWIGIARELSFVLQDSGELSSLGMEIKEIFSADTIDQASKNLDEFGYPRVKSMSDEILESSTVTSFGGDEADNSDWLDTAEDYPDQISSLIPQDEKTETPDSDQGKPHTPKQKPKRKSSRLISYVSPEGEMSEGSKSPEKILRRKEIGQLGVDRVIAFEASNGRDARDMDKDKTNHEGFDVTSVNKDAPSEVRYIEVKSTSGLWDSGNPAQVHKSQFEFAQEYGDNYWLYVVEKVESDEPKIYCIQNPANRVDAFMFDHGWRDLAEK
jgi:hypothetical protein